MTRETPMQSRTEDLLIIQRDLAITLGQASSLPKALELILTTALKVSGADGGGIYLREPHGGGYRLRCHHGLSPEFVAGVRTGAPDCSRLEVVRPGKPIYDLPLDEGCRSEGIEALSVLPVKHEGELIAVINLAWRTRTLPDAHARSALEAIAAQLGGVVVHLRAEDALRESERRFRAQFDYLPVPAYMWRQVEGDDFELVDHNEAAVGATRGKVKEIIGSRARAYYHDRPDILESFVRVSRSRTSEQTEMTYHYQHSGRDARLVVTYSFVPPDVVIVYTYDVTAQRRAAEELQRANEDLKADRAALHDKNVALREILEQIEKSKEQVAQQVRANVEKLVLPLLNRLSEDVGPRGEEYVKHLRRALGELTAPFIHELEARYATLTPRELEICALLRGGATSKEIARHLSISEETVRTQRKNIRRKLGITGGATNLQSFLRGLSTDARQVAENDSQ